MKNPISYSDLFKEDLTTGLDGLVTRVENVEKSMVKMLDEIKVKANEAGRALQSGGDVSALSAQIDNLAKVFENYTKALEHTRNTKKNMQNANKNETQSVDGLAQAYASLDELLTKTGVDVNQLGLSQKAANSAIKNGEVVAQSAAGSYNQLYAQYNLIKAALNAMSQEMRNSTSVGKVWENEALRIMDAMKAMQANTGNYTLSVGHYEKALNGVQISFNQITRELPSLTNSMSQFAIAISNNVPIFTDAIHRYSQAHKEAKIQFAEFIKQGMTSEQAMIAMGESAQFLDSTMKAVFSTFKSFAGWIGIIAAVIPFVIKLIEKKKKAQEEDNNVMKEAITLVGLMEQALLSIAQAEIRAASETITLTKIIGDETRSMDEQVEAARRLIDMHEEELSMYSAEEIAAGKAQAAIDNLTASIKEQARARAIQNKITEYSAKLVEYELSNTAEDIAKKGTESIEKMLGGLISKAIVTQGKEAAEFYTNIQRNLIGKMKSVEDFYAEVKRYVENTDVTIEQLKKAGGMYAKQIWTMYDEYAAMVDPINETQSAIDKLVKMIDPKYLLDKMEDKGGGAEDEVLKIPDYYWEMLEVTFGLLEDGLQKELALYDLTYAKESEERAKALKEMEGMLVSANADERVKIEMQMVYLRKMIADEEQLYIQGREDLINGHITTIDMIEEEGVDEEEKIRKASMIRLKADMKTRNSNIYDSYEKGNMTKAELDRALRDSERQYWEEYLADLRKNGVLTLDEYNTIMEKLAKADEKNNSKSRRKARLRNIVEVGFALSNKTGEKDVNGGRKVKDEYLEFADALNKGLELSMDYMDKWMDKRIEMAEVAIEQARREAEIAKEQLDYEQEARANGYANNVEMARKEYEKQLALQRKAEKEKEKLQKAQELIDTATQLSSLVTAVAEIWSAYGGIPVAGPILAAAVTATMFGAFAAAKIQAAKVARAKTYGEGMVEYLDYGGSHASGNDIDFGVDKKGRHRRVERGEMIGVINKRNVDRYGVDTISGIFNSLNKGTYKSDVVEGVNYAIMSDMYGNSFVVGSVTDLSMLEHGVSRLVEQGETKVVAIPNGRIEYRGNNKRIIYSA